MSDDIETVRVQVRQLKGNPVLDARAAVITKALAHIEVELERLQKANARLLKTLEVYDVPRVTDAERAEAQRVREAIE